SERLSRVSRCDYSSQILNPALEGEVADIPIGHPAAAFIVTQKVKVVAKETNPVLPDRTFPIIFEVGHPVCCLNQHGTRTRLSPRELHSVPCAYIADSLGGSLHNQTSLPRPKGTNVPGE